MTAETNVILGMVYIILVVTALYVAEDHVVLVVLTRLHVIRLSDSLPAVGRSRDIPPHLPLQRAPVV